MRLTISIDGGDRDEHDQLTTALRRDTRTAQAQVRTVTAAPEPGTLGLPEIVEVVTTGVLLPVVAQATYDFLRERWSGRGTGAVTATLTRTDMPDGTRTSTLTVTGDADAVVRALEADLG